MIGETERNAEAAEPHGSARITRLHTADFEGKIYNVYAVQEHLADVPVETVQTTTFLGTVEEGQKYWTDRNGQPLGPHELLADWESAKQNEFWSAHVAAIESANLDAPIFVHRASGYVFDGVHRLTKAVLQHEPTIRVKYIDSLPESAIVPDRRPPGDS